MKILHLFHNLMNLYGEYANTLALQRELEKNGKETVIEKQSVGDKFDFSSADFIYIGSGTEKNQKVALQELKPFAEEISAAMDRGAVVLATGNSFEMFGKKITDKSGREFEGLGLFDFTVTESDKRTVTDSLCEFKGKEIIGFINKASEIFGVKNPLFTVKQGAGNSISDALYEGICEGNFYGTHIIGPILIRNKIIAEHFADLLDFASK